MTGDVRRVKRSGGEEEWSDGDSVRSDEDSVGSDGDNVKRSDGVEVRRKEGRR